MTDKNLPPLDDEKLSEETAPTDPQRTRGNLPPAEDTGKLQRTAPIRTRPPAPTGTGQHVKPIPGQQPRRAPQRYGPRPPRQSTRNSGLYLPWWSLALMLVGVLVVSFGLVGVVYLLGNPTGTVDEATPIIRIITAEPGAAAQQLPTAQSPATQVVSGGAAPSSLSLEGPTLEAVQFTPTPVPITVGSQVAVEGVDENMLNVRDVPGVTASTIVFRAEEESIFTIVEGPSQADGFTWWRLQDPSDATRTGWAVANYLRVLP